MMAQLAPALTSTGQHEAEEEGIMKLLEDVEKQPTAGEDGFNEDWWSAHEKSSSISEQSSWMDTMRLLYASIKASAVHVEELSIETLAFGWLPLMKKHEVEAQAVQGRELKDSSEIANWLHYAKWADAAYEHLSSPAALATSLGIKLDDVVHIRAQQPPKPRKAGSSGNVADAGTAVNGSADGAAAGASNAAAASKLGIHFQLSQGNGDAQGQGGEYLPAYFVAVEHTSKNVLLVVRGTSALRDLVTDLCGHTTRLLGGHAHWGMFRAARALVLAETVRLGQLVTQQHPGYGIMLVGHSLGGGVAALAACMLRSVPELASKLGGAQIRAVTYATPPVMTAELAAECQPYVTTIVNNNDMITRTSVASIAELSRELVAAKQAALADSQVAAFLQRHSGKLTASRYLAKAALTYTSVARSPGAAVGMALLKTAVGAGLSMLGKQLAEPPASQQASASATSATPSKVNINLTVHSSKSASATTGAGLLVAKPVAGAAAGTGTAAADNSQQMKEAATAVASKLGGYFRTFSTRLKEEAAASAASTATAAAAPLAAAPAAVAAPSNAAATQPAAPAAASKFSFKLSGPASTMMQSPSLRVLGGTILNMLDDSMTRAGAPPAAQGAGSSSSSSGVNIASTSDTKRSAPAAATPSNATATPPAASTRPGQNEEGGEGLDGEQPDVSASAAQDQELHRLVTPGQVFLIERKEAAGQKPTFRLLACDRESASQQLKRLMIRKSAVKDHLLKGYIEALTSLKQGGTGSGVTDVPATRA